MEALSNFAGTAVGVLDRAYYFTRISRSRPRFFPDGWGDLSCALRVQSNLINRMCDAESCSDARKLRSLRWETPTTRTSSTTCVGSFDSPQELLLPPASKTCNFLFVSPTGGVQPWDANESKSAQASPKGVVLLMPSTGEQDEGGRLELAERLAAESDMCSVIITAPLYGVRRPPEQEMHYARTVELYLTQSSAIIEEAALLVCWCADRWPSVPVCVSGFSWGGAMTCCSAILASQWAAPARVLAVPYAGSATPAVIVDGLLEDDIDWPALAGDGEAEPYEATRSRLLRTLLDTHLSEIMKPILERQCGKLAGLHAVSFGDDHFVKPEYGEELFELASQCCDANVTKVLEWRNGGHVAAFLRRPHVQTAAIQAAFQALQLHAEEKSS
eukprot:TRINITY_DN23292_c0_g1_i2.p1 TRINITY_DN23292_c0_g1~~TRINITY_DN23292_c0_g1_i2.p1  ORF type:complete len:387 (-),score=61.16 TRINITY_DN23292_c0_g1_i2:121-1281(-)